MERSPSAATPARRPRLLAAALPHAPRPSAVARMRRLIAIPASKASSQRSSGRSASNASSQPSSGQTASNASSQPSSGQPASSASSQPSCGQRDTRDPCNTFSAAAPQGRNAPRPAPNRQICHFEPPSGPRLSFDIVGGEKSQPRIKLAVSCRQLCFRATGLTRSVSSGN